ncbi:hypothetical protein [Phenylobacterium sp.]|uniref:hypothetical protein n=1 Tax=Phenylobacterium sp. TaxID=1871053 RepID=UPI0039569C2C
MTLQLALTLWAVGAVAAFPALFEFNMKPVEDGRVLPEWLAVVVSVIGAVIWPLAWVSLVA